MTFPMEYSETADGRVKIKGFTPTLSEKKLINIGNDWYAADSNRVSPVPLAEELYQPERFVEGALSPFLLFFGILPGHRQSFFPVTCEFLQRPCDQDRKGVPESTAQISPSPPSLQ